MVEVTDEELTQPKQRWEHERGQRPVPLPVRFDVGSGGIVVESENGAAFMVPARSLEGLAGATDARIQEVELLGENGLHREDLDVDYSIAGLMSGIFGSRAFMDARRKGGQSRSPAKVAASRLNGARGGRPEEIDQEQLTSLFGSNCGGD